MPPRKKSGSADVPPPPTLTELVVATLEDHKAEDIVVIDLAGRTSVADAMIIASGKSARQVGAMADHVSRALKTAGHSAQMEGEAQCDWVLVDAGDLIVHLFRPEVRAFYNLEKMWGVLESKAGGTGAAAVRAAALKSS